MITILMYVLVVIGVVAGVAATVVGPSPAAVPPVPAAPSEESVMCTMDAQLCPDGSYVGRTGPNCEFVCPVGAVSTTTAADVPVVGSVIQVTAPLAGDVVSSPLRITGQARGQWYFEATFPVELRAYDDRVIAEGYATAAGDWMTTDFVPFDAEVFFSNPYEVGAVAATKVGTLVLKKHNASGEAQYDHEVAIPVRFAP